MRCHRQECIAPAGKALGRKVRRVRKEGTHEHDFVLYWVKRRARLQSVQLMRGNATTALPKLQQSLLSWYDHNRRDLPWRKTRDAYRVWVSEIMLQQTRVAAVLPRYENFLERFPSVEKLAKAREATVLAEWSGLGYYRRARNLHAAARIVARAGAFPQNAEAWRELPGIGRYTAAAISSIASDEPVAVLDGNVERVLLRLHGKVGPSAQCWRAAQELLDRSRPGDFNQAMMELGAMVCVPGQPICSECPIQRFCRTRGRGASTSRKPRQQKREIAYWLGQSNGSVLLVRRPKSATLMPSMWELPPCAKTSDSDAVLFSIRHSITNTDYTVRVIQRGSPLRTPGLWVKAARAEQLPLTGLARKILSKAGIII
jgi:A/G-specific adenine glycosylase